MLEQAVSKVKQDGFAKKDENQFCVFTVTVFHPFWVNIINTFTGFYTRI